MAFSEMLNWILGGGLLTAVLGLLTLRSSMVKAKAEADKAKAEAAHEEAEAERVRIDNTESATKILLDYLLKPLLERLNETTEELNRTKRELNRTNLELARNTHEQTLIRKALERATGCNYNDICPVLDELRQQKGSSGNTAAGNKPRGGNTKRQRAEAGELPVGGGTGDGRSTASRHRPSDG